MEPYVALRYLVPKRQQKWSFRTAYRKLSWRSLRWILPTRGCI